jgi:hypothetical protein
MQVELPGSALAAEGDRLNVISISAAELRKQMNADRKRAAGVYWRVNLDSGQDIFSEELRLTLTYADSDGNGIVDDTDLKESELQVYYYDPTAACWQLVPGGVVNAADNYVQVKVAHFTEFALGAESPAPGATPGGGDSGDGGSGGGCFITTAAYGTYLEAVLWPGFLIFSVFFINKRDADPDIGPDEFIE